MEQTKKKKVLIVRLSSLGDVIFTVPLANLLKENGYEVGWLVSEKGIDIVKNNSCVDKVFLVPLQKWKKKRLSLTSFFEFIKILNEVRKEKYDIAYDSQRMFKSLYWMLFCGAKRKVTLKGAKEFSDLGGNEFMQLPNISRYKIHAVEVNFCFARHIGLEPKTPKFTIPASSKETIEKIDNLIKDVDKSKPMVIIAPATTWVTKHWNKDHWKTVVDAIKDKCSLVFTGTESDKELISYIGGDQFTNLAGKTNVKELFELFSRAKLVMAPDSGSAHLAWASANPAVIAIFTCTPPTMYGPYGDDSKYFAISGDLKCQPCHGRFCPLLTKDKMQCVNYPQPEKIINIVNKLL